MKGFLSRALATVALTLCALPIAAQTAPTYSDETVISFLGSPTKEVLTTEMTPEYLMSLLDENGKKYVESIEYKNVLTNIYTTSYGVTISSTTGVKGYLKINFRDKIMKAGRIILYGGIGGYAVVTSEFTALANENVKLGLGKTAAVAPFEVKFGYNNLGQDKLLEEIKKQDPAQSKYGSSFNNNKVCYRILRTADPESEFPLKSLTIQGLFNSGSGSERGVLIHGIKIMHNGFVENDINTGVEEIAQENGAVEYFDLYGRRLADKPTQGMFIEKRGSKVTKLLAR